MSSILQEGIYYSKDSTPGKFFCLLFLRTDPSLNADIIGEYFSRLWDMYLDLKKGIVRDLPGHKMPDGNLTVLVGYGQNLFKKINGIKMKVPFDLERFGTLRSPLPLGG